MAISPPRCVPACAEPDVNAIQEPSVSMWRKKISPIIR